ncbi:hypothetical protein JHK87_033806 [Glycine soja]|nr:hypothetical protein JHK87_033806 [Glycine soja]
MLAEEGASLNAQVMVLAATYRPSELDEAILQHLPQAFEIGVPDQRERIEILKVVLKGERVEDNIDFGHIAGLCEGYTSLDLFDLCKKATYFPIIELLDEEKKGKRSHDVNVERVAAKNSVIITVEDVAQILLNVVQVTKEDDTIHNYQVPNDDCFAHL